jgi:hypothetical protein
MFSWYVAHDMSLSSSKSTTVVIFEGMWYMLSSCIPKKSPPIAATSTHVRSVSVDTYQDGRGLDWTDNWAPKDG